MGNHTALTLCSLFVIKLMMSMYDILKLKYSVTESYLFLKLTFFLSSTALTFIFKIL